MVSTMRGALWVAATLLSANVLYAQLQLSGADLAAIEAAPPLPATELPAYGNFYSSANPGFPPLPVDISGLPGWNLGGGNYLLDDLNGNGSSGGFRATDDAEPLIPAGGVGSGDGSYGFTNTGSFPTNGLWLQITNVSDGAVYANLNGATDYVYAIVSCTNLSAGMAVTNWNIETEVFPGVNTNTMPFTVSMSGRNALFLSAFDWTGVTSNGNQDPYGGCTIGSELTAWACLTAVWIQMATCCFTITRMGLTRTRSNSLSWQVNTSTPTWCRCN